MGEYKNCEVATTLNYSGFVLNRTRLMWILIPSYMIFTGLSHSFPTVGELEDTSYHVTAGITSVPYYSIRNRL